MEAERDSTQEPSGQLKAIEAHHKRMKDLRRNEEESGDRLDADGMEARAYLAEADLLLAQAKSPKPESRPKPGPAPASAGPSDKPGKDPRSLALLLRLEEPVAMSFANDTPLEDVLVYIKQATAGPKRPGIPIYVDPQGLQQAEKSLTSPIQIDLEGIPLRRTLQLLLKQLGLTYFVDDGILVITSQDAEETHFPPSTTQPSPFVEKQERAERGEMSLEEMKQFVEELKVRKEVIKLSKELEKIQYETKGIQ
jgi:hypothetical protein